MILLLLSLLACDEAPDPCEDMCAQAAAVQCGCLDEWGADWSDIGYSSQEDFFGSCETWAWQMRLLEEDAVDRGLLQQPGAVDQTCEQRAAVLQEARGCKDWTAIDWRETPWD